MHSRQVEIKSPCHESWDAMHGDDARRFCDVCAKHVHNLSAMQRDEAADLLRQNQGEHLCVRYASRDDGSIAFRGESLVPVSRLRSVRTAFAAVALAACTPHGDGPPIQDIGDITIEAMARDAVASPEGGCDVRTGPLTTLHFPAGHAVCRHLPDAGATILTPPQGGYTPPPPPVPDRGEVMGELAAVPPPTPPTPPTPTMGQMAPPVAKMGEAVPELKEPCDPQQGFAPPPPQPPEPTRELMGKIAAEPPPEPPLVYQTGNIAVGPPPPPPPSHVKMGDVAVEDIEPPPPTKMGRMKPSNMKTGGAVVGDID